MTDIDLAFEEPADPFAGIADRIERLTARTEKFLAEWTELERAEDPRLYLADRPENRRYGFARGEGWCLSAGGIETYRAEGDGIIDGHAVYYRAYGIEQTSEPDWSLRIAPIECPSAVMVGWNADGISGWIAEGVEADEPDLPKCTTRPGAWARTERVAADFRAGTLRWFDAARDTDYALALRLLADIGREATPAAWFAIPHPTLSGRTPDEAVHAGDYRRVNALVLAERVEVFGR